MADYRTASNGKDLQPIFGWFRNTGEASAMNPELQSSSGYVSRQID